MDTISGIRELAGAIGGKDVKKLDTRAAVVSKVASDGTVYVRFPGNDVDMPVHRCYYSVAPGDTVPVTIAKGRATIGGNASDIPASGSMAAAIKLDADAAIIQAQTVQANLGLFERVVTGDLEAQHAHIGELEADTAKIHSLTADELSAATGYIADLKSENIEADTIAANVGKIKDITGESLSYATGYIADLKSKSITTGNIQAATGFVGTLGANDVTAQNIVADHETVGSLGTHYAQIDAANVTDLTAVNAWLDKVMVQTGMIAHEGTVYTLDAIQVNAANITAGTIDVERLIVTVDGQKYMVHIDPSTSQPSYEKLDGDVIEDLTITADKIVAGAITAEKITTENIVGSGGWINLRNGTFNYHNAANTAYISWDGTNLNIVGSNLNSDITSLSSTVTANKTSIENRASKIEQTLDGFSSTVSATIAESVQGENVLTGNALNPNNWTINAPTAANFTKAAYGTAGTKVTFDAVSGYENLYSPDIPVTNGSTYTLSVEYTVGKGYNVTANRSGYGLGVYKGTGYPSSAYDESNAKFIAKAAFFRTQTRVAQTATVTFTATSDKLVLMLNGGHIADGQTGLSFTIDKLKLVESISSRMSASETAIKQTADAIGLSASGATTIANPSLSPFFESTPYNTDNDYWRSWPGTAGFAFEDKGDGWIRVTKDNTSGTSVSRFDIRAKRSESVLPGEDYTFLFEYRNNKGSSLNSSQTYVVQNDNCQFWGSAIVKPLDDDASNTGALYKNVPSDGTVYTRRVLKKSEATGSSHWTGTVDALCCLVFYVGPGEKVDIEIRVSLYEGAYRGSWKPYSGSQLYTSRSEFKVTTDGISSEVSKVSSIKYVDSSYQNPLATLKNWAANGHDAGTWNVSSTNGFRVGDTVYVKCKDTTRNCDIYIKVTVTTVNSGTQFHGISHGYVDTLPVDVAISTINQSAESVKISASKVEIDGTAVFTAIKPKADAAYDAKNAASTAVGNLKTDLASSGGTTVIDGGHIKTNSLAIGNFNSATQEKINNGDAAHKQANLYTIAGQSVIVDNGGGWVRLGTLVSAGDASNFNIHLFSGDGYNASATQNSTMDIVIKDGWQSSQSATSAFGVSVTRENRRRNASADMKVKVIATAHNTCTVWVYFPWSYIAGHYSVGGNYSSWTDSQTAQTSEPGGTAQDIVYYDPSETATNYITADSSGIKVHNAGDSSNYAHITSNGMQVYKGGTSVASFGESARVGKAAGPRVEIQSSGVDLYGASDGSVQLAHFGYASGNAESGTTVDPYYTFGMRQDTNYGNYSVAEGYRVYASGFASHAEGSYYTNASGVSSHAEGYKSEASGNYAHAEGNESKASKEAAHSEGYKSKAAGKYSHAEGYTSEANGEGSHAEGASSTGSSAYCAHSEGNASAENKYSHAEGESQSRGESSHSEGAATANGDYSHAEGYISFATKNSAHAQNYYTRADSAYQTAMGKYNVSDTAGTYALIIGNGTSDTARKDIFNVEWDGDTVQRGSIYFQGTKSKGRMIRFMDNTADEYGNGVAIGAGGLAVLGAGESADNLITALSLAANNENAYVSADGVVCIVPNCNTIANRKVFTFTTGGNLEAPGLFQGTNAHNAITAKISAALNLATSEANIALASDVNVGSGFSIVSGGVKCAVAGTVSVTALVYFSGVTDQDQCNCSISKGSTQVSHATARSSGNANSVALAEKLVTVAAGDVLYLSAGNGNAARGTVPAYAAMTYMTVKYV